MAAMQQLAKLARVPILLEPQGATKVAAFAREHLRLEPGQKCVVVSTATAAKRAAIVTHFLRRGGYFPLHCELPDGAPLESNVAQVMDAAKRTGSTFVAAYGGGATLSVGKAAAALLTNGGRVADYAPELGGRRALSKPSLPLLAVPSCPCSSELTREAHILFKGQALASLRAHPASVQGALVDPALAVTLTGEAALTSGYATFVHCVEALLRPDSDTAQRALAFEGVQRAAYALGGVLLEPRSVAHRSQLAVASLIASALLAQGPLGASRGLGLAIAGRYNVAYSAAVTALAPEVLAGTLDAALQKYETSAGGDDAEEELAAAGGSSAGSDRELVDESALLEPASKAMQRRVAKTLKEDADAEGDGAGDDDELRRLLVPYSKAAAAAAGSSSSAAAAGEDEDAAATLVRLTRLAGVVHRAVDRAKGLGARVAAAATAGKGSGPAAATAPLPPSPSPSPFSIEPLGADWRHFGAAGSDAEGDLSAFRDLLVSLREVGAPVGVHPPTLDDFKLTPVDLQAVAEAAEVDPNTTAHVVPLRKSDLLTMLRAA
jgi:alcohol dehydrogenase class IV